MNFDKFLEMKPMKYVGGASAKKHVANFLSNPLAFKDWRYTLKVDGEWCRIVHDLDGNVTIQGRGISTVTKKNKDNTELLPHLVSDVQSFVPKGTVLIGELAFENYMDTVQVEVGAILRCKAPKAIERQASGKGELNLYVFDVLAFDGKDLSDTGYEDRYKAMLDYYSCDENDEHEDFPVFIHQLEMLNVDLDAISYLDSILEDGGEGIMIMHKDGKYLPGSRSVKVSLKIKKELGEMTVNVVNTLEPNKAYEGMESDTWEYKDSEGNLVTKYHALGWKSGVEFEYKGNTVKVTSGISDADAEWLASEDAQELIRNGGLKADVTAMSESIVDGVYSLRHPVLVKLRTDL